MAIAVFKKICPNCMDDICPITIGHIRVYDTNDIDETVEPAQYKFITTVIIDNNIATLHGLKLEDFHIVKADITAIDTALAQLGNVSHVAWVHKLKSHTHRIKES